jgi:branched-subunit amino acid ABC-type transport system permease component
MVLVMGNPIPVYCFFLIGAGALVGAGLYVLMYRTRWGAIIRTAAYDRDMTSVLGVNVPRLYTLVFALGAGLGGFGGAVAAPMTTIIPDMGMLIIIESFAVIIIGGVGSLFGAALGALIIGVWSSIGLLIVPQFAMVFTFVLMAVILLVRPWGLFGDRF